MTNVFGFCRGAVCSVVILLSPAQTLRAQRLPNPVLPGVCDAGVLRYNGRYYIGGVGTNGSFYYSDDLMNWRGPEHVFSMDNDWTNGPSADDSQIHANDMHYINGVFHLFWSVNYWGRERHAVHIAHAVSGKALGPYREPVRETWLDNRIDPMLFRDDDGKLYLYGVRFTDGNTIWARPMSDPGHFSGDPVCQFPSLPGTWETMDNRVAEGPWVFRYRKRYYMVYNANHTGTEWGNYQLGVAEADSPTAFNHGGKYPYPVLTSNQLELEDRFYDLLRYSDGYDPDFAWTGDCSGDGWMTPEYDDEAWNRGCGGFGTRQIEGSSVRPVGTLWQGSSLRLRKHFRLADAAETGNLALRILHDAPAAAWLNGVKIYEARRGDYRLVNLPDSLRQLLRTGDNVLAVESIRGDRPAWLDCGLFDTGAERAGDILFSPGQPNVLRGPNGLEWWLVYMANKNGEPRGQYIGRVHFSGRRLFVEPISSARTEEYVSVPSPPTFSQRFDGQETELSGAWNVGRGSTWRISETCLTAEGRSDASLKDELASVAYNFETMVSCDGCAGVVLCRFPDGSETIAEIDARKRCWRLVRRERGRRSSEEYPLPAEFDFSALHAFTVRRNAGQAELLIDDLPAPGVSAILLSDTGAGVPGVVCSSGTARFGTVSYTIGWDEYGENICGWERIAGCWRIDEQGMTAGKERLLALKGEPARNYDVSLQVTCSGAGTVGYYPLYADSLNYVRAEIDPVRECLLLTRCRDGREDMRREVPLPRLKPFYADMKYSDFIERRYTLEPGTRIDRILLPKQIAGDPGRREESIFDRIQVEYLHGDVWRPISPEKMQTVGDAKYCIASFDPVTADAVRFLNRFGDDLTTYTYRILMNERFKSAWHLRAVRRDRETILFLDGRETARISDGSFGPTRVGIVSNAGGARFDGIVYYRLPQEGTLSDNTENK